MNAESPRNDDHTVLADSGSVKPPANLRIDGYEIIRELHHGGQGVVFEAIQKSTKRKVAIKVLLEGAAAPPTALKRFDREVELIAQLKHPNIITVFDSRVSQDGRRYYVMDYVQGQPLNRYVREEKLDFEEALKLFAKVCEAVQYAHQRGVIHRDLKPSNILVETGGTPKVLDFGLAKLLSSPLETLISLTGQLVGTVPYMSPEQVRGKPDEIDARSDVYALGVILYQMLTGQYPYPVAGDLGEILHHIKSSPPTPPSRNWTPQSGVSRKHAGRFRMGQCPIDRELQTIVMQALAKEPERRYQSAGNLAEDVGRYLRQEPVQAKRDHAAYLAWKWVRRRYRVLAASLVIVTALGAAGYLYLQSKSQALVLRGQAAELLYYEAIESSYGDVEGSLRKLDAAANSSPALLKARYQKAFILKREGRIAEAEREAQTVLRDHPDAAPMHLLLTQLYLDRDPAKSELHRTQGEKLSRSDRYFLPMALPAEQGEAAIEVLKSILNEDGTNFEARWELARRYRDKLDWEGLLAEGKLLATMRPKLAAPLNLQGIALSRLGKYEEAEAAYTRALTLAPHHSGTRLNRADVYVALRRFEDAKADCEQVIAKEPKFAGGYAQRAWVALSEHPPDLTAAEDYCRKAIALDENWGKAHEYMARIALMRKDMTAALASINKAIAQRPKDASLFLVRGGLLRGMKNLDGAQGDYSRAINLDPHLAQAYGERGLTHYEMGNMNGALSDFRKVAELNPDSAFAAFNLAKVHYRLGSKEVALEDASRAIELAPKTAGIYLFRGFVQWSLGNEKEALNDFDAYCKNEHSPSPLVYLLIHDLQLRLGNPADAAAAMQSAKNAEGSKLHRTIVEETTRTPTTSGEALAETAFDQCELFFHRGLTAMRDETRIEEARIWFTKCLSISDVDCLEEPVARRFLLALPRTNP